MTVQSIFSKVTKAAVALPIVAAGLAFNAGSAAAAGLWGSFQINNFLTTANLGINAGSQNTDAVDLVFVNNFGASEVALSAQTGDFVGYESAFIENLIPADTQSVISFLDLSEGEPAPFELNTADGLITFDVTSNDDLDISQQVDNLIAIDISLGGIFNTNAGSADNYTSKGQAIFTLQYAETGITVDDFTSRLQAGEIFEGIAFSGAAFTAMKDVPEPATILGLLAISGLAGTAIRKRKEA